MITRAESPCLECGLTDPSFAAAPWIGGCPALAIGFAQSAIASSVLISVHQCPRSAVVAGIPIFRRAERMLRANEAEVLAVSFNPIRIAEPRLPRRTVLIAQFDAAHLSKAKTSCSERRETFARKALDVFI